MWKHAKEFYQIRNTTTSNNELKKYRDLSHPQKSHIEKL